ncbi:hypothetical protein [Alkaliphilus sp. B6464]|uniref:hypothetical protein n=1 Tax=Alkaliphilus sp. B6464 TaxID=2731219 RepID=UPI001BA49482|nr:hypothetical protein [Alkaliphilus sp. B6464]QUH19837.1 hypothetical protein HYG84_07925 [Alkaliphilus sp. B6464]
MYTLPILRNNLMYNFKANNLELFKEFTRKSEKVMLEQLQKLDINVNTYIN